MTHPCLYCGTPAIPTPYKEAVFTQAHVAWQARTVTVCQACADAATTPTDPDRLARLRRSLGTPLPSQP